MAGELEALGMAQQRFQQTGNMVSNLGATLLNNIYYNKNRRFAASESQKQRDWTQQMLYDERAYNTPSAQMSRLVAAGLNPNLAYGQMDMTSPTAGSGAEASYTGMPDTSSLAGLGVQMAQIRNLNANTNLQEKKSELTIAQVQETYTKSGLNEVNAKVAAASLPLLQAQTNRTNAEVDNLQASTRKMSAERRSIMLNNYYQSKTMKARVGITQNQFHCSEVDARYALNKCLVSLNLANSEIKKNLSQSDLNASQYAANIQLAAYYFEQSVNCHLQSDYMALQTSIYQKYGDKMSASEIERTLRQCEQMRQQTLSGYIETALEPAKMYIGFQQSGTNFVKPFMTP